MLVFQVYKTYYRNVFLKTSTTLTAIIALGRYFGICHPLKFRRCVRLILTKTIIAATGVFWIVFNLPLLWNLQFNPWQVDNTIIYSIDTGIFSKNKVLKKTFTYIWMVIGYVLPLIILTFCNIQLIRALNRSRILRQRNAPHCRAAAAAAQDNQSRITQTLILLTCMYILCVSPSELLHFYQDTAYAKSSSIPERIVVATNALQVLNLSCHFILYCLVNPSFRSIVINMLQKCFPPKFGIWRLATSSNVNGSNVTSVLVVQRNSDTLTLPHNMGAHGVSVESGQAEPLEMKPLSHLSQLAH